MEANMEEKSLIWSYEKQESWTELWGRKIQSNCKHLSQSIQLFLELDNKKQNRKRGDKNGTAQSYVCTSELMLRNQDIEDSCNTIINT